jgi:hypothetical protein
LQKELLGCNLNVILLMKEFQEMSDLLKQKTGANKIKNERVSNPLIFDDILSKTNSIVKR